MSPLKVLQKRENFRQGYLAKIARQTSKYSMFRFMDESNIEIPHVSIHG